jgi:hypothetical protein
VDAYGQVLFQPWLAGSPNGILSVKLKDSTLLTYSLVSPIANVPGAYKDSAEAYQIDGHHIFSDPTTVKIIETWNRPTVYLRISADAEFKPITFDVLGLVQEAGVTSFERPTALRVVRDVPGFVPQIIDLDPKGPTTFKWPIGNYRIYFIWDKFGRPGLIYTGPSDGGKG